MKSAKSLERKIDILVNMLSSFEKKLEKTNERVDRLSSSIESHTRATAFMKAPSEFRAITERFAERDERAEQGIKTSALANVHGRHREIVAMLINNGFQTYKDIAKKLGISESRARAYIAELKNEHKLPLTQIRDAEGYKVGIEMRFIEEILSK